MYKCGDVPHQQLAESTQTPYQKKLLPRPDLDLKMHAMYERFPGTKGCHASWD